MSRSSSRWRSAALRTAPVLGLLFVLGGCNMFGSDSRTVATSAPPEDSTLKNFFKYGSSTPPAVTPMVIEDDFVCPEVEILDGAAAWRQEAGGAVRSQISIGQTARECVINGNMVTIKVGVEGRALLGTAGSPGTFTAPVRFVIKSGDKVLVSRLQRKSVTIPAGDTQAPFVMVEEGMTVPKDADLTLLVGLDPNGRAEPVARKKRGG
jgi:hypothetical protein